MVDKLRGTPLTLATLEEMIDENHAIVSINDGPEFYVAILSFVDREHLDIGATVLCHYRVCF